MAPDNIFGVGDADATVPEQNQDFFSPMSAPPGVQGDFSAGILDPSPGEITIPDSNQNDFFNALENGVGIEDETIPDDQNDFFNALESGGGVEDETISEETYNLFGPSSMEQPDLNEPPIDINMGDEMDARRYR